MRRLSLFTALLVIHCALYCQQPAPGQRPNPSYHLISGGNYVQSKNYYLLTLLQENSAARQLVESDTVLASMARKHYEQLSQALTACGSDASCFTGRMKFSAEDIAAVSARLLALYTKTNALGKLVDEQLIPSGTYILFYQLAPEQLLVKAWEQDANGINFAIGVYGEGKKANYPNIDSISFNVNDRRYAGLLYTTAYTIASECSGNHLFFALPLTASLQFIELNDRNRAADYEPMATTENKAAVDRIKTIAWNKYKYTLILVPGAGPEEPTVALSAEGMLRCRMAALQYHEGLAPFIMVSGGKVHPYKTNFCEAMEMKHFLVYDLHIPENAVIVEPHARHTTTNMRNCARLIFRYGMPFSKPCLTATSRGQSTMITATLAARCEKELQEIPFKNGLRLSETEAEFYPLPESLHINPMEPMDP